MRTAKEFLELQTLFYVFDTSVLRLNLSWKNKDQLYDLECKFCNAVYSNSIITNNFSGSKKAGSTEYSFLLCKNCGSSQGGLDGPKKPYIYKRKFYKDYTAGDVPFPDKYFEEPDVYKVKEGVVVSTNLSDLDCFKEIDTVQGKEDDEDDSNDREPNKIYLCVTDATIVSGLNPYGIEKRKALIDFYSKRKNITHHDYAAFNKEYNGNSKRIEKEVVKKVDKSELIKLLARNSKFKEESDAYAIETIDETLTYLGIKLGEAGTAVDNRDSQNITIEVVEDKITITREDGCVKTGIIENDTITEVVPEKVELDESDNAILQSYINKTTGCKSEINVHKYLDSVFEDYRPCGDVSVSGELDDIYIYGFIDAVIGKKDEPPTAIIEIKKRMNKIFTLEELIERKYDLCQLVLYKFLMSIKYPENKFKLYLVQSFGDEITIERIRSNVQQTIIDAYNVGIEKFVTAVNKK